MVYFVTEKTFRVEFVMYVAYDIYCNNIITKREHLLIKFLIVGGAN